MYMKINVIGKNLDITDDIRAEVLKKFERLDKYFADDQNVDVRIATEGNDYKVEVTAILDGGTILRAEAADQTYQNAVDRTIDALMRQVRKHKTRLMKDRHSQSIRFENFDDNFDRDYGIDDSYDDNINVARHKEVSVKPMSTEEAIMQMELIDHDFYVFQSDEDMSIKVVYRRKNGGYGQIIPVQK